MSDRQPMTEADAPATWDAFPWPEWVPKRIREMVADFWGEHNFRRVPRDYLHDIRIQGAPVMFSTVTLREVATREHKPRTGRYVHGWNNIGWVVDDSGERFQVSFAGSWPRPERRA